MNILGTFVNVYEYQRVFQSQIHNINPNSFLSIFKTILRNLYYLFVLLYTVKQRHRELTLHLRLKSQSTP